MYWYHNNSLSYLYSDITSENYIFIPFIPQNIRLPLLALILVAIHLLSIPTSADIFILLIAISSPFPLLASFLFLFLRHPLLHVLDFFEAKELLSVHLVKLAVDVVGGVLGAGDDDVFTSYLLVGTAYRGVMG
jgi:hypothetical protein